jgi:hypothetical protein
VYNQFAKEGHTGGKDANPGYGGPAMTALLEIAHFESEKWVVEYGCEQGKLAKLVLLSIGNNTNIFWRGIDQSPPKMVEAIQKCGVNTFGSQRCMIKWLKGCHPNQLTVEPGSVDPFLSTYCLDLLSKEDMLYHILDLAQQSLHPEKGLLLMLAGITWG